MQTSLLNLHCRGATGYAAKPNIRKIENKALIYGNKKECWDSNHGLVTGPQHSFVVFQPQGKGKNYVRKIQCQSMEIKRVLASGRRLVTGAQHSLCGLSTTKQK